MEAGAGQAVGGERRSSTRTPWAGAELRRQGPAAIPAAHRDRPRSSLPGSPPTGFPSGVARGGHPRASGLRRREARALVSLALSCVVSPPRVQPWALGAPGPPLKALGRSRPLSVCSPSSFVTAPYLKPPPWTCPTGAAQTRGASEAGRRPRGGAERRVGRPEFSWFVRVGLLKAGQVEARGAAEARWSGGEPSS